MPSLMVGVILMTVGAVGVVVSPIAMVLANVDCRRTVVDGGRVVVRDDSCV
jgi:hypothetical protein